MKIVIGRDHAGYPMKGPVVDVLRRWGHEVTDLGVHTDTEDADFPDIAQSVCDEIKAGRADRGMMICGTGVGAAIAVNKVPGIRAALYHDVYPAHQCVEHDDVNVVCMGTQIIGIKLAEDILSAFLSAEFSVDKHFRRRVAKLTDMEIRAEKEFAQD